MSIDSSSENSSESSQKTSAQALVSVSDSSPSERASGVLSLLDRIKAEALLGDISLQQLLNLFGDKSHQMFIFSISIPFMQPIPLVGLSTPLGVLIALASFLQMISVKPWIPQFFANKKISSAIVIKSAEFGYQLWSKIRFLIKPRLGFLITNRIFKILSFIVVAINGILLALPLPIPFSNTVPNVAIVLNSMGQLEEDGVLILLSYLAFFASLIFFGGLWAGIEIGFSTLMKSH